MEYEYHLINNSGDVINKVKTESLELAIELFAKIKKLKPNQLLEIYKVERK
jgi:hypothetical protein